MAIKLESKYYQEKAKKHIGCRNLTCKECGLKFDYEDVAQNRFFCPVCGSYMDVCEGCGQCGKWN